MGNWIDGIKFAGGSFALMPPEAVKSINKLAHDHDAYVSTGGWIENVLRFGPDAVDRYVEEAKALGFDVIEISTGFISLPTEALLRLVETVKKAGLKAKPELGIQFGPVVTRRPTSSKPKAPGMSAGWSHRPGVPSMPAPISS